MKIYREIVINLETLEVLSEDSFEYEGPVAEAKGGSSSTTTTVDYRYNDRMAYIAEEQQAMAREYHQYWQTHMKPFEEAQLIANYKILDPTTNAAIAEAKAAQLQAEFVPEQLDYERAQMDFGLDQMDFGLDQMDFGRDQMDFGRDQMDFGRDQMDWARTFADANLDLLPQRQEVTSQLYDTALAGMDINARVNQARAASAQSFDAAEEQWRRDFARMGVNPNSGNALAMANQNAMNRAQTTAGAMIGAKNYGEQTNFNWLNTAAGLGPITM